jgi:DinB superfamily
VKIFDLKEAIAILERTPAVLQHLLDGLTDSWIKNNEGGQTWSPYDIVGHLIHGEKTDWISRTKIILDDNAQPFAEFDRFAQFKESQGKSLTQLLDGFKDLRKKNLAVLGEMKITDADLPKTGRHPELGTVTLRQLLASWVAHDLGHIRQITRVMAKQYKNEIGPWERYLPVVHE